MLEKNKTKLIHGQHGGVYGQYKYEFGGDHEIKVSDKYLSWGWKRKNCKNLIPFGMLTKVPLNNKVKSKKEVITILNKFSHRYSINFQPGLNYSSKINFFNDLRLIITSFKHEGNFEEYIGKVFFEHIILTEPTPTLKAASALKIVAPVIFI